MQTLGVSKRKRHKKKFLNKKEGGMSQLTVDVHPWTKAESVTFHEFVKNITGSSVFYEPSLLESVYAGADKLMTAYAMELDPAIGLMEKAMDEWQEKSREIVVKIAEEFLNERFAVLAYEELLNESNEAALLPDLPKLFSLSYEEGVVTVNTSDAYKEIVSGFGDVIETILSVFPPMELPEGASVAGVIDKICEAAKPTP